MEDQLVPNTLHVISYRFFEQNFTAQVPKTRPANGVRNTVSNLERPRL